MKVSDDMAGSGKSQAPANSQAPATTPKTPDSKPFASILDGKREAAAKKKDLPEELGGARGKAPDLDLSAGAPILPMPVNSGLAAPEQPAGTSGPDPSAAIQGLVKEIVVAAPPGGPQKVDVQFNSKTLDGLKVHIANDNGTISIRFSTTSPAVSQLLSRNISQLSDSLHAKGLQVAPIQVELNSSPAGNTDGGFSPRDGRRGQDRGRQNQQQQQQKK